MALTVRGKVQEGRILLANPVALADGTEVEVDIRPVNAPSTSTTPQEVEDFLALPVFGMWAGREDMKDGGAWVRREREKWHEPIQRRDYSSPMP